MSRTTRMRLDLSLLRKLTQDQAVMGVNTSALRAIADAVKTGTALSPGQIAEVTSAVDALGVPPLLGIGGSIAVAGRARLATAVSTLADNAAIQQRGRIAAAVTNTLKAEGWMVTVVDGGHPDRYTGIEATRNNEHLIAAVGPGELIADQAGAHDCAATADALAASLRELGGTVIITDDVPHDGTGGALYALPGGPTRAHAVQASLRALKQPSKSRRRAVPASARLIAGSQ
jgi:hypothetical protein